MNIRDRIAKLLALSESPNEHEAKAALLKARELMATHKLRPEDVLDAKEQKVIRKTIRASCTKMTNKWAVELSAVIAPHYCCKAYYSRIKRTKTATIGLITSWHIARSFARSTRRFIAGRSCGNSAMPMVQVLPPVFMNPSRVRTNNTKKAGGLSLLFPRK